MKLDFDRTVAWHGPITEDNLNATMSRMRNRLEEREAELPLYLDVESHGGDPDAGIAFYGKMRSLKLGEDGKDNLHTLVSGSICSAAVIVFLAGSYRYMMPHSLIQLHRITTTIDGRLHGGELGDKLERLLLTEERCINIIAAETDLSQEEAGKMVCREQHLTVDDALQLGFAHEILESN